MFSGLSNWLERSDEEFLKDLYTDAGRRYKIENLRRARQKSWQRVVGLSVIVALHVLVDVAAFFLYPLTSANLLFWMPVCLALIFTLIALSVVSISNLVDFQRIDTQIKILILVAQLKTD